MAGGGQTYTAHAILVFSVSIYADPLAWVIRPGWRTVNESASVCRGVQTKVRTYWPNVTRCPTALGFRLDIVFLIIKYRRKTFLWSINPPAVCRTLSHGLLDWTNLNRLLQLTD